MARRATGSRGKTASFKPPKRAASQKASPIKAARGQRDTQLEKLTERLVRLTEERKGLGADLSDLYAEAKDKGYDVKVLRRSVKILSESSEQRSERLRVEEEADVMLHALGHLADTPLGEAAREASAGKSPPPKPPAPEPRATTESPASLQ
jgi:uncharacterized protein (UPF0335 family)